MTSQQGGVEQEVSEPCDPAGSAQTVVTENGQQIDMISVNEQLSYNQGAGNIVYVNEAGEVVGQAPTGTEEGQFTQQIMDHSTQLIPGAAGQLIEGQQIIQQPMEVQCTDSGLQYDGNVVYQQEDEANAEPTTITTDVIYQNPDGTQFIIDANGQQHQVIVDMSSHQDSVGSNEMDHAIPGEQV